MRLALTWLTNHHPSVLLHCWLGHLTRKIVSEMTYNVSSGTLNTTIPYLYKEEVICNRSTFATFNHLNSITSNPLFTSWPLFDVWSVGNDMVTAIYSMIVSAKNNVDKFSFNVGRLPSCIRNNFTCGHLPVVDLQACCCVPKFIKIKWIFVEIWWFNDLQYSASLPRIISKFTVYVTGT